MTRTVGRSGVDGDCSGHCFGQALHGAMEAGIFDLHVVAQCVPKVGRRTRHSRWVRRLTTSYRVPVMSPWSLNGQFTVVSNQLPLFLVVYLPLNHTKGTEYVQWFDPRTALRNSDALRQLVPEQSGFRFATPAGAETVATQCPVTLPVIPAPTVLRLVPAASQAPGLCPSDRHEGAVAVVDLQVVGPVAVVLQLVELVEAVVGPDVVAGADLPPCAPTTLGRQMGVRNGLFTGLWRAWQVGSLVRGRRPNAIQISEFSLPSRARPVELFAEFLQCRPLHRLLHDKERRPLSRSRRCRSAPARSAGPPDRTSDGRGGHARRFAALRSLSAAGCVRYRALEAPWPSSAGPRR